MAKRILPSLSEPSLRWIKALHSETNECMGIACWTFPGVAIHNPLRKSAISFYSWDTKMNWTHEDIVEMFAHVSEVEWNQVIAHNDDLRAEYFQGEGHWFLSPVCTWPQYQGKGVGKKLLLWAIEQADASDPVTPLYLESAPSARKFYEHLGFEPVGKEAFVRRVPRTVDAEDLD
jgi:GNAT superfamily N-acetyltransferase